MGSAIAQMPLEPGMRCASQCAVEAFSRCLQLQPPKCNKSWCCRQSLLTPDAGTQLGAIAVGCGSAALPSQAWRRRSCLADPALMGHMAGAALSDKVAELSLCRLLPQYRI